MKRYLWAGGVLALLAAGCASNTTQNETATTSVVKHEATILKNSATLKFSSEPQKLEAGKAAAWTIQIRDEKSGGVLKDFAIAHEKLLHLIVVSKELSQFTHLHPAYKGNGIFEIKAALPRPGTYKLFADYTPKNGKQQIAQYEVEVAGQNPLPRQAKLVPVTARGSWFLSSALAHNESEAPQSDAAKYQVALMPMPSTLVAGKGASLHFQVRDMKGKPIQDLQPYLGAMGHLVIISRDASEFLHAHPMSGGHDQHGAQDGHGAHSASTPKSDVLFHTNFSTAGIYKAWAQFRHQNKIITAPFVLKVEEGKAQAVSTQVAARAVTIELPGGYKTGAAKIKAGQAAQVTFVLKEDAGCGNDVVFSAAHWRKTFKVGERVTVKLPPQKRGELKFACGMDMYKGSLLVQ